MHIGKIVSSSSHVDYVCQVYGQGEAEVVPQPQDHGFGTFVGIEQAEGPATGSLVGGDLVGVIYNTTLLNPEFGSLGPRLSPREELAVFSPDYLSEKVTLVTVAILGSMGPDRQAFQGVPPVAANLDARVRTLDESEIVAFHRCACGLRVAYLPLLAVMGNPLMPPLMMQIVGSLCTLFPEERSRLAILGGNLSWKSRVEPLG
ncbi:MAG: hypothetical protein ACYC4R_11265 [Anaerolineae bacterium]